MKTPSTATGVQSRLILEGSACPAWVLDARSLAFLEVNEAAARLYGYTREEFLGMTAKDLLAQEDAPPPVAAGDASPDGSLSGRRRHRTKDGGLLEVDVASNPIDWDGRPAHLVLARDITRQVATEQTLRDMEERFSLVSRATNDVVWDWDLTTNQLWWNEGVRTVLGYAEGQVGPDLDWWKERIHPDDRDTVIEADLRMIEEGAPEVVEYRIRRADDTYAHVRDRCYVVRDTGGRAVRMIGAMMDVTAQRGTEQALRESQELMNQMAQAIQDVFYVSDAETNEIIFMNAAFDRIWGLNGEKVRSSPRSWLDRVHVDDRERIVRSITKWKPQGEAPEWNEEFRIVRPDGAVRWIWIRSFPIRDASGEIVRFAGVERDITERKRAEETVRSLLAITRHLSSTLDVNDLMEALVTETLLLLDAEGGCAGLLTAEGMTCEKYFTRTGVVPFSYRWPVGRGLPGWVARHKLPYITHDAAGDPQIVPENRRRFRIHRAICMPVLDACGEVFGFIQIHDKRDGSVFDSSDEEKLSAVARAASVAIQNALAYRKLGETAAALRAAEEKYRGLFEYAEEGIGRTTAEGRILAANPALARMLGYDSPEDMIESIPDIGMIYVDNALRRERHRVMEKEDSIHGVEAQVRRKDGTLIWILLNLRAVKDPQGRLLHYDGVAQDITARKQTEEALREATGRLLQSQSMERRRIARELHDSTAQSLAAVAMNLSLVDKAAARLDKITRRRLADSIMLAKQSCREVRTLSYLLHPPALEASDLWTALRWYAQGFTDRSGIRVDVSLPRAQKAGRLPEEIETTLFRIVQEGLANIHRHSGSRRARIRITRGPSRVTLGIRDEGRGLKKTVGRNLGTPALTGVGIAGMRERVRQLGGEITIDSSPRGTAVKVMLPLAAGH